LKRLAAVRADRSLAAVSAALEEVRRVAATPERNLMPAVLEAVAVYASVGEIVNALADVFGRWHETPTI